MSFTTVPINNTALSDRAWVKFFNCWKNAYSRCTNEPTRPQEEPYYGLEVWSTFGAFKADMLLTFINAYKANPECSLDRRDNFKGYNQRNCKWSSKAQQQYNKSTSNKVLAINPDSTEAFVINSGNAFARHTNLAYSEISRIINGKFRSAVEIPHHKNWRFFIIEDKYRQFIWSDEPFFSIGKPYMTPGTYNEFIKYQKKLGYGVPYASMREQMAHVSQNCLALTLEVGELLRELPHKPWRAIKAQPHNEAKAIEELIDILFFANNIAIAMGWSYAELVLTMAFKKQKNNKRLKEGYHK